MVSTSHQETAATFDETRNANTLDSMYSGLPIDGRILSCSVRFDRDDEISKGHYCWMLALSVFFRLLFFHRSQSIVRITETPSPHAATICSSANGRSIGYALSDETAPPCAKPPPHSNPGIKRGQAKSLSSRDCGHKVISWHRREGVTSDLHSIATRTSQTSGWL
jgi:hypothetical protein